MIKNLQQKIVFVSLLLYVSYRNQEWRLCMLYIDEEVNMFMGIAI